MKEVLIFAGTSEGRALAEMLARRDVVVRVCVATEYGKELMTQVPACAGRLDVDGMREQMQNALCVVDATHPYAQEVTKNIRAACAQSGLEYMRLLRAEQSAEGCVFVESAAQAAEFLCGVEGKILVTTGSKEAAAYRGITDYKNRVFLRILPMQDALMDCLALGFHPRNLICMQGPFTEELNAAMLEQVGARWLVTKESGVAGGFLEKVQAARRVGAQVLVIGRPQQEQGYSLSALQELLMHRYAQEQEARRFPLFVSLKDKRAVVFGGGKIALRRIKTLLRFECEITVIAPEMAEEVAGVRWERRAYNAGDTAGAAIVLAATNDAAVNAEIARECNTAGIPVSVASDAALCSFYFPAVICHGDVTVGVTANGIDHALAKRIAEQIRNELGDA